jgi:hypothetical protein
MVVSERALVTLDSEITRSKSQVSCDLAGEAVILSLSTGEYYGLNPVAARIWELLEEARRVGEIRDLLLAEYPDVTPEDCSVQVLTLLEELAELDLVIVRK